MSQYFPKLFRSFGENINVKIDLSIYATKTDLASLKTEVDNLDIDKGAPVLVDFSKLSHVVENYVVRRTVYDKLVTKVNNIDTSAFVLKNKYQTEKTELEKKIPDATDFLKRPTELEDKIPDVSGLETKTELIAVENKMLDVSSFVKKQIMTHESVSFKRNLLIMIMTSILLLQNLML